MALSVGNFLGAEERTNGVFKAVTGTVTPTAGGAARSGGHYYTFKGAATAPSVDIEPFEGGQTDQGNDYIIGVGIRLPYTTPASDIDLIDADSNFIVRLKTTGNVDVIDANGSVISSITTPFTASVYSFVEVYWQKSNTGTIKVYFDNVEQTSDASQDLDAGTGTLQHYRLTGFAVGFSDMLIDDFYCMSGAASEADRLGNAQVLGGYTWGTGATEFGTALDAGAWSNLNDIPPDDADTATYTTGALKAGGFDCDGASNEGPSGDAAITGTIHSQKGFYRAKRGTGSATTHSVGIGKNGVLQYASKTLTTSFADYFIVDQGFLVTSSDALSLGMQRLNDGGRDIEASEMIGTVLHTPPAVTRDRLMIVS